MKTAWMWGSEHQIHGHEIYGLNMDLEQGELLWYRGDTGSLCGDDDGYIKQKISEFQRFGPPPSIAKPPADVTTGMNQAMQIHHRTKNPEV